MENTSVLSAWELSSQDVEDLFQAPSIDAARTLPGPHSPRDFARKLYAYESLQPSVPPSRAEDPEPYSLQWFLDIERHRHSRQARWIPKVLEFAKHSGEKLLGLGHGLGTDWVQYAQHGAGVIVCNNSPIQLELIRRNFEVRHLHGRFVHADATRLPLDSNSIDVAFLSTLDYGRADPRQVVDEVYRVLKPGGKVLAVTSARYDIDFWVKSVLFWYRWLVPDTDAHRKPGPDQRYSGRELCRLFDRFCEHKVYKRQLRRSEIPHVWRFLPTPLLSRFMGRVLIVKAFKPLRVE
jgi:ubiquinone/menaquinone biosynthesis C-methylase UbiE